MNISAIAGYGNTLRLLDALYPVTSTGTVAGTSPLTATAGVRYAAGVWASISPLGSLLSQTDALAAAATALAALNNFDARTVRTSQPTVATASATPGTATGNYALAVTQLAQAQTITSALLASPFSPIGSGAATLTIAFASGQTRDIRLAAGDTTLNGIAAALNAANTVTSTSANTSANASTNAAAPSGVSAAVIGQPGGGYQLRLNGPTGAANAFTLRVSGNAGLADFFAGGTTIVTQAQNAIGRVNGLAFEASTNTVSTAQGLTLALTAPGNSVLSVAVDPVLEQTLGAFVVAYNAVQETLGTLDTLDAGGLGANAGYLRARLAAALGDTTDLAVIGIGGDVLRDLSVDTQLFASAVSAAPARVAELLGSGEGGLAMRIADLLDSALSATSLLRFSVPALYSPNLYFPNLLRANEYALNYDASYGFLNDYLSLLGTPDVTSTSLGLTARLLDEMLYADLLSATLDTATSDWTSAQASTQFLLSLLAQQAVDASLLNAARV